MYDFANFHHMILFSCVLRSFSISNCSSFVNLGITTGTSFANWLKLTFSTFSFSTILELDVLEKWSSILSFWLVFDRSHPLRYCVQLKFKK